MQKNNSNFLTAFLTFSIVLAFSISPLKADCSYNFVEHVEETDNIAGYISTIEFDEEGNFYVLVNFITGEDGEKFKLGDFEMGGDFETSAMIKFDKNFNHQWHKIFNVSEESVSARDFFLNDDGNFELIMVFEEPEGAIDIEGQSFETDAEEGLFIMEVTTEGNIVDGNIPITANSDFFTYNTMAKEDPGKRIINIAYSDTVYIGEEPLVNLDDKFGSIIANLSDLENPSVLTEFKDGSFSGIEDLQITSENNIVFSKGFTGTVYFENDTITNYAAHPQVENFLVSQISDAGEVLWNFHTTDLDSTFGVSAGNFTTDRDGNIYVLGESPNNIDFGNGVVLDGEKDGQEDGFVLKLNNQGEAQWATDFRNYTSLDMSYISKLPDGELMAGGNFNDTLTFGEDYEFIYNPADENYLNPFNVTFDREGNFTNAYHFQSDGDFRLSDMIEFENFYIAFGDNSDVPAQIFNYDIPSANPKDGSNRQSFIARICNEEMFDEPNFIQTKEQQTSFKTYPNPAEDMLKVDRIQPKDQKLQITIFNTQGQQVLIDTYEGSGTKKLDISGLEKGIYLLQISENQEPVYNEKIIRK